MSKPRILLQTTIPYAADDWHVGRFTLLRDEIATVADVTARDHQAGSDGNDPVLIGLPGSAYDQLWLIGVDAGDGLSGDECSAISDFHRAGGAIFSTRDHMDLGSSLCSLGGIGLAHYFHSKNPDPNAENRVNDDRNDHILWPNYHSGDNGEVQHVSVLAPNHPALQRRSGGGPIRTLPAHPHEGAVGAPPFDPTARVVVTGKSSLSGRAFNIAIAFEPDASSPSGRGWAESTFHHFCDYNWDVSRGCPSFVEESPSDAIARDLHLLDDTRDFVHNLVDWLGTRKHV